jgi:hypothetical protein
MHLSKVDLQNVLEKIFMETPNCACTIISCSAIFRKIVCINQHFNLIDIIFSCDIDRSVPWKKPILKDSVDAGCSNHDTHPDPTVIGSNHREPVLPSGLCRHRFCSVRKASGEYVGSESKYVKIPGLCQVQSTTSNAKCPTTSADPKKIRMKIRLSFSQLMFGHRQSNQKNSLYILGELPKPSFSAVLSHYLSKQQKKIIVGATSSIMETLPREQVQIRSCSDTCYHTALGPQFVSIVPGQFELGTVVFQPYIRLWIGNLVCRKQEFTLPYPYKIQAVVVVVVLVVIVTGNF